MKTSNRTSAALETVPSLKASKNTTLSSRKPRSKGVSAVNHKRQTASAVLKRLDIDPEEVALLPREPAEILTRCLGDGSGRLPRQRILSFAAVSNHPCAIAFTQAVRGIKKLDMKMMSFEALCVRARVSPVELLGAILMAAKSMKATESALKAILAHPEVVDATVETAKVPGVAGHADRKILHEAVGFLPTRKGSGIEINFGFGRPPEERDEETDSDADWDDAFPALGDQIQEWSREKHRLLEGGK